MAKPTRVENTIVYSDGPVLVHLPSNEDGIRTTVVLRAPDPDRGTYLPLPDRFSIGGETFVVRPTTDKPVEKE